jgi:GTP-binding protein HflX
MVLNKVDAVEDQVQVSYLKRLYRDHVVVSARTGAGVDLLKERIVQEMRRFETECHLAIPVTAGKAMSFLYEHAEILEERCEGETIHYRIMITKKHLGGLRRLLDAA